MSSSTPETPRRTAAVVTVSDSRARGEGTDVSGPAVANILQQRGFDVVEQCTVPDDLSKIQSLLTHLAATVRFVATTGGTGIAPRDVTPEATRAVCSRIIEGVAEQMRRSGLNTTNYAVLSRGVCGVREQTLILNLPGSPQGAVNSLEAVLDLVPHILDLLEGKTEHSHQPG
jgi:molybdopterin adenylyltransferase